MNEFLLLTLEARVHEDDGAGLPEMLRNLALRIETEGLRVPQRMPLHDENGNAVGWAQLEDVE